MKTMQARFPGRCQRCRGEIRPGEEIVYAAGRGAFHPACAAQPTTVTTPTTAPTRAPKPNPAAAAPTHEPDPRAEADRLRGQVDFGALRALNAALDRVWVEEFTRHSGFGPGFWPALRQRLAEQGLDPHGLRDAVRRACGDAARVVLDELDGRPLSSSMQMSMALGIAVGVPARLALGRVGRHWRDLTRVVVPIGDSG
jgi:hypothetical protein